MSEAETKELIKALKEQTKESSSSKASSLKLLQEVGILDKKGDFTKPYSELGKACTAVTQD